MQLIREKFIEPKEEFMHLPKILLKILTNLLIGKQGNQSLQGFLWFEITIS